MEFTDKALEAMRTVRTRSDYYLGEASKLSPRGGAIAVGSEHTRQFQNGESLAEFLRVLGRTGNPTEAREMGHAMSRLVAAKWNQQREWQVHLWSDAACALVDWAWRLVLSSETVAA